MFSRSIDFKLLHLQNKTKYSIKLLNGSNEFSITILVQNFTSKRIEFQKEQFRSKVWNLPPEGWTRA